MSNEKSDAENQALIAHSIDKKYATLIVITVVALTLYLFPGHIPFIKLWVGLSFSAFIITAYEQYVTYRSLTFSKVEPVASIEYSIKVKGYLKVLFFTGFCVIAIFFQYPASVNNLTEENRISTSEIESIIIQDEFGHNSSRPISQSDLEAAKRLFSETKLSGVGCKKGQSVRFKLTINTAEDESFYMATVRECDRDRVRLNFHNGFYWSHLSVPGLGNLLVEQGYIANPI